MRLLSNNPRKLVGIEGYQLSVAEWIPLEIPPSDHTRGYLKTKKEKLGHKLTSLTRPEAQFGGPGRGTPELTRRHPSVTIKVCFRKPLGR